MHGSGAAGDTTICHTNVVLTDFILGVGHFDLPCYSNIVLTVISFGRTRCTAP